MQIKILNIEESLNRILIKFESAIGIGAGIWVGDLPTLGEVTDIEFDIDDDLEWGKNITMTDEHTSMITIKNDHLSFIAQVISYERDGCLTVNLGETIVFLDLENAPLNIKDWVVVKAKSISLFPTNM